MIILGDRKKESCGSMRQICFNMDIVTNHENSLYDAFRVLKSDNYAHTIQLFISTGAS